MSKIADILSGRGQTNEALRILVEECLPVARRLQDIPGIAHIRYSCAQLRHARGEADQSEAQTILDELAEAFRLYKRLGSAVGVARVGSLFGVVLAEAGRTEEALTVLNELAEAFEKLDRAGAAAEVRALQERIRNRKGDRSATNRAP